jgi:hypothetical protein
MKRFRRGRRSALSKQWGGLPMPPSPRAARPPARKGNQELESKFRPLLAGCGDCSSRNRLAHLFQQVSGYDRGAKESALAEIEMASLLLRSGCIVRFLPESGERTADLECYLDGDRFYVEVTALVGGAGTRRPLSAIPRARFPGQGEDNGSGGRVLIRRLLARISQKARQLSDYAEPVALAVTVPFRDPHVPEVDLKELSGAITLLLPVVPQVSAVVLFLWNVEPAMNRSAVRLNNVHVVERSVRQSASPRARLLIMNPSAVRELTAPVIGVLKGLL